MRNQRKSIRLGAILSGDATVEVHEIITSTGLEVYELAGRGDVRFEPFYETLDSLLRDNIHLSDWIIQEVMKRATLSGLTSEPRIETVGIHGTLRGKANADTSKMFAMNSELATSLSEGDWQPVGQLNER